MSVTMLCQVVHTHWQHLRRYVWPMDAEEQTKQAIERLTQELHERYKRLVCRRRTITFLRTRLEQSSTDHVSSQLRLRLARQEDRYARQRHAFLRRKQLCKALRQGVVVACGEAE